MADQEPSHPSGSAEPSQLSSVEVIVDALVDEESYKRIRIDQEETLARIRETQARVSAMTKATSEAYGKNAAEFVKAARTARSVRRDLESATRRIANLKARLLKVRDAQQAQDQDATRGVPDEYAASEQLRPVPASRATDGTELQETTPNPSS